MSNTILCKKQLDIIVSGFILEGAMCKKATKFSEVQYFSNSLSQNYPCCLQQKNVSGISRNFDRRICEEGYKQFRGGCMISGNGDHIYKGVCVCVCVWGGGVALLFALNHKDDPTK